MLRRYPTDLPRQPSNIVDCVFCYSRLEQRVCGNQVCNVLNVVRVAMCWAASHVERMTHVEWFRQRGSCRPGMHRLKVAGHMSAPCRSPLYMCMTVEGKTKGDYAQLMKRYE
jgi:hypothetical protein